MEMQDAASTSNDNASENRQVAGKANAAGANLTELALPSIGIDPAEISRQNGSKSRGPKTAQGKNRSRLNALKHGLSAKTLLLQTGTEEEQTALERLRLLFEQEFPVRTIEAQLMLESLVLAVWQKRRSLQFEAREMQQELIFHGPIMDRILRYSTAADKRLFRALEHLKQLQHENLADPEEKVIDPRDIRETNSDAVDLL
ncbi:MAG TPA: hypothetical protein VGS27_10985 [Candidatus Sulfotelmatobacter sp.]|nr:hypothetical protein [Candidatus Sulfotelmatobacter sp.]